MRQSQPKLPDAPRFDTVEEFERFIVNEFLVDTPEEAREVTAMARDHIGVPAQ